MIDIQTELVEAIRSEISEFNGVQIFVDQCAPHTIETQDFDGNHYLVSHVKRDIWRTHNTMSFDFLKNFLIGELKQDITAVQSHGITLDKLALILKEVPIADDRKSISYVKVARKVNNVQTTE